MKDLITGNAVLAELPRSPETLPPLTETRVPCPGGPHAGPRSCSLPVASLLPAPPVSVRSSRPRSVGTAVLPVVPAPSGPESPRLGALMTETEGTLF